VPLLGHFPICEAAVAVTLGLELGIDGGVTFGLSLLAGAAVLLRLRDVDQALVTCLLDAGRAYNGADAISGNDMKADADAGATMATTIGFLVDIDEAEGSLPQAALSEFMRVRYWSVPPLILRMYRH